MTQGTVRDPLFYLHTNDLRNQPDKNCEVLQHVDETLLLASSPIQQEYKKF